MSVSPTSDRRNIGRGVQKWLGNLNIENKWNFCLNFGTGRNRVWPIEHRLEVESSIEAAGLHVVSLGSCAAALALVAAGRLAGYVEYGTNFWDCAQGTFCAAAAADNPKSYAKAIHGGLRPLLAHLVAQQLFDLSGDLVGLADRDEEFKLPAGRGDEFARGGGPDPRDKPKPVVAPRDMFVPDLHIDTLKVKSRNFH